MARTSGGKKRPAKRLEAVDWTQFSPTPVIGVDEAGRGCLAGPVVAAAVILRPGAESLFSDSKMLSESRREELYERIVSEHRWAVGLATAQEIDSINILRAALLAMKRAVEGLRESTGHVLVDGNFKISDLKGFEQTAIIKGDQRVQPISAASIVAKVTRDRLMKELHDKFPHFQFLENKGYGTAVHLEALRQFGPTEHHRKTFRGVVQDATTNAD